MMLLAYLLRTHVGWRGAEVRLKLVVPTHVAADSARENLRELVGSLRIGAHPEVLVAAGRPFGEILLASSADADLVFMGLAQPGDDFPDYMANLQRRTEGLPTTAFVLAAEDVAFGEVLR